LAKSRIFLPIFLEILFFSRANALVVKVNIEPSIEVKTLITPSQAVPNNYWLALEIKNQSSSSVTVSSLLSLSREWEITRVQDGRGEEEEGGEGWAVEAQQSMRVFLHVSPRKGEEGGTDRETVSVITQSPQHKRVPLLDFYSELASGAWDLPESLSWSPKWVPQAGDSLDSVSPYSETSQVSDVPIFSFLSKDLTSGGLQERKIKLKNLITPPLSTYIDGGADHSEQDRKKQAEEIRNSAKTRHMLHVIVNWHITSIPLNISIGTSEFPPRTCLGQFNVREISLLDATPEERQSVPPRRRNSLVTLMEAQDELQLPKAPLVWTVQSMQRVDNFDFDENG
jgi:hypothetical protein